MRIYTFPHSILREQSELVLDINDDIQTLIDSMGETMYEANGVGLSAIQVGRPIRLFVYDISYKDKGKNLGVLINPKIVATAGESFHEESCLSVIGLSANIKRSSMVKVSGLDRHGKQIDIETDGLLAICFQHEIDHLDGKLFIDYLSNLKRSIYKRKLQKMKKFSA